MADVVEAAAPEGRKLGTWLFNPFHYVAGGQALLIGLVAVLAAAVIGSLSNTHFDGVLDVHTGLEAPLWVFVFESVMDWLALGAVLFVGGALVSKSRFRALDVFGTQALARAPTLVTVVLALLPGYQRYLQYFVAKYMGQTVDVEIGALDPFVCCVALMGMLLMLVWMVALMYRAFAVSCNVRGCKAIGTFIACLLAAEAVTKALSWAALQVT